MLHRLSCLLLSKVGALVEATPGTATDVAGIQDLIARLNELRKMPSRITKAVAARIDEELKAQFERSVNAYGNPWKPLLPQTVRRKFGDARILRRTDELSQGIAAKAASGSGIEITAPAYGQFHQTGTKFMAARKLFPDGKALPPAWRAIIADEMAKAFGGRS
jgi:phage gpG-like protein